MKKIYLSIIFCMGVLHGILAQNIGINASGSAPAPSAMLDVSSTNSGLLIPRVALTTITSSSPVTSPATSLLVYNTATAGTSPNNVIPGYYFWNGTTWSLLIAASSSGSVGIGNTAPTEALDVTGNFRLSGALMPNNVAGTSGFILQSNGAGVAPTWVAPSVVSGSANWTLDGNNVLAVRTFGTTSNFDLPFITNNTEQMRITATGSIGIGTTDIEGEKVLIDAGATQTALSAVGTVNDFLEINVQNFSNGALASSDIVATANNGTENSVYVDLGINSAGYSNGNSNILNGANLAYAYANANDFKIGNGTPGRNLIFFTNPTGGVLGTNTANGVERVRISAAGFVGIGTANPAHLLHLGSNDAVKPGGGSWSSPSDRRLKKDIAAFTDGLNVLTKIKPVSFRYNGSASLPDDGKQYIGIIAQEMQEIAPYTIDTFRDDATNTDYLNYNSNAVTYILINAVKEQQTTIDALKKQLEDQNKRLTALENKLK